MENGPTLLFKTVFLYSLLEYQAGHISEIAVDTCENSISVSDDGRGHNVGRKIDGIPYLEYIYSMMHLPGDQAKMPEVVIQALGISLVSSLCEKVEVEGRRADSVTSARYEYGKLVDLETKENQAGVTGNRISLVPSAKKLNGEVSSEEIRDYLVDIRRLNPDLRLTLNGEPVTA